MASSNSRPTTPNSPTKQLTHDPRPQTSHIHRLSALAPPDAPPLNIRFCPFLILTYIPCHHNSVEICKADVCSWFYATDTPKKRLIPDPSEKGKQPSKWTAFASRDSRALEIAFQHTILHPTEPVAAVPVNEDHLFEVDIVERELKPVYFKGSTYEVRRGAWFFQEGSVLRPCDENLATQIEEGYIKLKPFRAQATITTKVEGPRKSTESAKSESPTDAKVEEKSLKEEHPKTKGQPEEAVAQNVPSRTASPFRFGGGNVETAKKEMIWKLLGDMHMGKYVVYTSATTAWLLSDDLYGKLTASVYQTLTAGVHLGGAKLVRGYMDFGKTKEKEKEPADIKPTGVVARGKDKAEMDRVADKVEEKEMEEDYDTSETEDPTRQIDHLIFCVHGIGQKLGERMEGVNFVHGTLPLFCG